MKILITGGAGFIGHHFVEHLLKNTDWEITVFDRLNYASLGFDRLRDINVFDERRVRVFTSDFTKPIEEGLAQELGQFDYIVHMGAETHVDNSITNPEIFVTTNVLGTMHMLNFARTQKDLKAFLYFSTDEVFGPAPEGVEYKEWDRYNSGNPYAAAKAGGEELTLAFGNTYRIPIIITHTMNVFGERQHIEKFIPKVMRAVLGREKIYIHSNKDKTKAGSRYWIHGRNVAAALMFLLLNPEKRYDTKFNIVGEQEVDNLTMAENIAYNIRLATGNLNYILNYEMVDFHSSRPGHDLRYALNGDKMKSMGWKIPMTFEESLRRTVEWSLKNDKWIK